MYTSHGLPSDYATLDAYLGNMPEKRLAHNTTISRFPNTNAIVVTFHATKIAAFRPDGSCDFTLHGWATATTIIRLNALLGSRTRVFRRRGYLFYTQNGRDYNFGADDILSFDEAGTLSLWHSSQGIFGWRTAR